MKTCFKCGIEKPEEDFYKSGNGESRSGKCKECTKSDVRANRAARLEYYREYDRSRSNLPERVAARMAYAKTPEGIERAARARKRYVERNPEKKLATTAVSNAVRDGKLTKPSKCDQCGDSGRIEGHHKDYSKPLDVDWLCVSCHVQWHLDEKQQKRTEGST